MYGIAQLLDHRRRLHAPLAAAMSRSKSLRALPLAYFVRISLQLRRLAASLAAHIRLTAWRAPAVPHTMGLPSA
jgi:hypothetical protein